MGVQRKQGWEVSSWGGRGDRWTNSKVAPTLRSSVRITFARCKNKVHKRVTFFRAEKHAAKSPHLPCNPPRSHHQKTTLKTLFSAKPPAKTTNLPEEKNTDRKSTAPRV